MRSSVSGSDAADLDFLGSARIVDEQTLHYLKAYRFGGNIWGYAEGDCDFPGSPILVVEGTFAEAASFLETITLSILNHDCVDRLGGVTDGEACRRSGR